MVQKIKRRNFLGHVVTAAVGGLTLTGCIHPQDKKNAAAQTNNIEISSGNKLAENREMPRELVMKLLDQKVDRYMHISYNCAQSSFLALQEQFGLAGDDVLKALTPLTGIAERGETCGAVTGSLMIFGLIYGRGKGQLGNWNKYRASLIPSGKFCEHFEKQYGSTMCCDIQKKKFGRCFHLIRAGELKEFQEAGATDKCSTVVQSAVRAAAAIILDYNNAG